MQPQAEPDHGGGVDAALPAVVGHVKRNVQRHRLALLASGAAANTALPHVAGVTAQIAAEREGQIWIGSATIGGG